MNSCYECHSRTYLQDLDCPALAAVNFLMPVSEEVWVVPEGGAAVAMMLGGCLEETWNKDY